eukprot:GEMP01002997.1.p1 GENE.GEMP01002997.1~~GEMP01002997.1.p1  ORF type:complete len:1120 (+),score=233.44 GEMP01002997.1:135-3494(+)
MNSICVVLQSLLSTDDAVRKPAERQISEAKKEHPEELMSALLQVLSSNPEYVLRQQAAVYISQLVDIEHSLECSWNAISEELQNRCKETILCAVEAEENAIVLNNLIHVAAKIADLSVEGENEGQITLWPQLLPTLWVWLGRSGRPRRSAMEILRQLTPTIGSALVCENGMATLGTILTTSFQDEDPATRVTCCLFTLALIEEKEISDRSALSPYVRTIVEILMVELSDNRDGAKSILEGMINAIDVEPDFFKPYVHTFLLPELIQNIASRADMDQNSRELAMEIILTFIERKPKFCAKPSHRNIVNFVVAVNMEWLIVDEALLPTSEWIHQEDSGWRDREDNFISDVAEENLDRLAKALSNDLIVPIFGTFVEGFLKSPTVWNREQAAMMAIYIVAEYVEDFSLVEKMATAALHRLRHDHVRVRHAALRCIMELSEQHETYLQEAMAEAILSAIVVAMNDSEPRVATLAMTAFQVFAEPMPQGDLIEEMAPQLLETFWNRLENGATRSMREEALTGIAVVAEVIESSFAPFYDKLMPLLKNIIELANTKEDQTLQGKAIECLSMLGRAVGKEKFLPDAKGAMNAIVTLCQQGFDPDGVLREYIQRSAERICEVLHEDFAEFLPHILPNMLQSFDIKPEEVDPLNFGLGDEDDMTFALFGDRVLGVKTSVLMELLDVLKLIHVFVRECKAAFAPYLRVTCASLLPLLENPVTGEDEHVRSRVFDLWGAVVECAKQSGDQTTMQDLMSTFINGVLPSLEGSRYIELGDDDSVNVLQSQAKGLAAMIRAAGSIDDDAMHRVTEGVKKAFELTEEKKQTMSPSTTAAGSDRDEDSDDSDSALEDEEQLVASLDRLRICLADVFGAVMETSSKSFHGPMMASFADLARKLMDSKCPEDKVLAMHVCNDMLEYLGDCVSEFGDSFWTQVLDSICDREPAFRIASGALIVQGAQRSSFQKIAPLAVEKLRFAIAAAPRADRLRRKDPMQTLEMQAVENATAALGWVLEHHSNVLQVQAAQELWEVWVGNMPLLHDEEEAVRSHAQLLRLAQREKQFVSHALRILCEVYKTDCIDEATTQGLLTMVATLGPQNIESMISPAWSAKQKKKMKFVLKDVKRARNGTLA